MGSSPIRVRFAPSPTGSLHLGNALTAVANRDYADAHRGVMVLRIDDTDAERSLPGGEEALLAELEWLEVAWEEGPVRQSEQADRYAEAAARALGAGAVGDADGSIRLDGITLVRPDGTATYQLASVVDDLALGITHIIRGSDHRPNEAIQRRIAVALGGELPPVIHHGLLLGADGKKLSKRHGHTSVADLRKAGIPAAALRAYLDELGMPEHDVQLDETRIGRLAIDAIAAMPDEQLCEAAAAPLGLARALRGARTLVEAREIAAQITTPSLRPLDADSEARPTLERFAELRAGAADGLDEAGARELVREVKAVGGNLRALRAALTGAERGAELWAIVAYLPREEALARIGIALG
ncbi:MAG: glutamate--tRNA ligase family protein [Gaiellales bacterium]